MKTNVAQTSIAAYISLTDLNARQAQVYQSIHRLGVACNQLIANELSLPINQVTGRVKELREKGLVKEAYKAEWEPTGKTVIWWQMSSPQQQEEVFYERLRWSRNSTCCGEPVNAFGVCGGCREHV